MMIHFIGPGGAGKTTTAQALKDQIAIEVIDLDTYFIDRVGNIAGYIDQFGYAVYASRNIELYLELIDGLAPNLTVIMVCSSGFLHYPPDVHPLYKTVLQNILDSDLTLLFLASLDLEVCVELIVKRQMQRKYLNSVSTQEEHKIRKRFNACMKLPCKKIITDRAVLDVVSEIKSDLKLEDIF